MKTSLLRKCYLWLREHILKCHSAKIPLSSILYLAEDRLPNFFLNFKIVTLLKYEI